MITNTFWTLVPSIVAIVLALVLREPHVSLFIGAALAAFLLAGLRPVAAVDAFVNCGLLTAIAENAGIIAFVVILGVIIQIIRKTNGSAAFGKWAAKHIKTQTGAVLATFVLGILIFIDDMFNCFTVGAVMMPVTDRLKISRQKLAWLLDATAAPVCMIAPISSWGAAVSSTAAGLGTGESGISLFIRAIPFNFYSLLTLVFIVIIGILNFDYGKMAEYQKRAVEGDLGAKEDLPAEKESRQGAICDLVIPVVFMIVVCSLFLLYVGGFFDPASENYRNVALALGGTDGASALSMGGLVTLVFTVVYSLLRKVVTFREVSDCVGESFRMMGSPLIILILAVSLKNMTMALGVQAFISHVMEGAAASLTRLLPAVIFLFSCLFSFACGSSWGTFGILIPIVTAVFPADSPLLIVGISACLAGAVCGDHCSPISDTTIMSSAAAMCDHVSHVETQLPYAMTVAAVSFAVYVLAGFVPNALVCLPVGAALIAGVLLFLRSIAQRS